MNTLNSLSKNSGAKHKPLFLLFKSGAPGGTRTPDLLVRRRNSRATANDTNRKQPKESTKSASGFRSVLAAVAPCSRTITRTILAITIALADSAAWSYSPGAAEVSAWIGVRSVTICWQTVFGLYS